MFSYGGALVHGILNANPYQALAYAIALNLRSSHLIYAEADHEHTHVIGKTQETSIHNHRVNLAATPAPLLDAIDDLAFSLLPSETRSAAA